MFYEKSDSEFPQWREQFGPEEARQIRSDSRPDCCDNGGNEGHGDNEVCEAEDGRGESGRSSGEAESAPARAAYEREVIASVWECAETVPGTDSVIWRKDEYGAWIHRADYGRRTSEFGWEIFDPGVGRHHRGVFAMRPMQWQSYISQYATLL